MESTSLADQLAPFSSCDVADALQKLGRPDGGFVEGITMLSPEHHEGSARITGPVYTVKYVSIHDDMPNFEGHYIDAIPPQHVLFISSPPSQVAVYGGLMSTRAKFLKVHGTVVDGRIRDLQEHRDLKYAVWARGTGIASPSGNLKVAAVNVPVPFQGVEGAIQPGDYIVADLDGVALIPQNLVEQVLALMPSQVEADERIASDLKRGRAFAESAKEHRQNVKKKA